MCLLGKDGSGSEASILPLHHQMSYTVGEMYVRVQKVRQAGRLYEYVHIVEGYRGEDGKVRHRVVANLGRRDQLKDSGALDNLAAAFTRLDPAPGRYLLGAMPLVVPLLQRLDVAGIVARACPMRGRAHLTHGEVIAALVANRLTAPRPLYDVAGWANDYAVNDWLGTPGALLNDDRLGRALDALAGHIDEVASAIAMTAIAAFGIDAARLHWDFTSVAFCGSYDSQHPSSPRIGYGHSSDRKSHRRQLKVAHATTGSGVPLFSRVVDGAPMKEPRRAACSSSCALWQSPADYCWSPTRHSSPGPTWRLPIPRAPGSCHGYPDGSTTRRTRWESLKIPGGPSPIWQGARKGSRRANVPRSGERKPLLTWQVRDEKVRRFRVLYIYGSEEAAAAAGAPGCWPVPSPHSSASNAAWPPSAAKALSSSCAVWPRRWPTGESASGCEPR